MRIQAKITSRDRITVPVEIRQVLGVRAGDTLLFENVSNGVHIRPVRIESVFAEYAGIGTPGIPSGKKGINKWLRQMRGHID